MSVFKKLSVNQEKSKQKKFKRKALENFILGMVYGLGQAVGLTIIFALVISYLGKLFNALGGLPYFGIMAAIIMEVAERTLEGMKLAR